MKRWLVKVAIYAGIGLASWVMVWFAGYNSAKDHYLNQMRMNEARLEREIDDFRTKFEIELEQKQILQDALAEELKKQDEEAIADPESTNNCISPDGLRRLNQGFGHRHTP